MKQMVFKHNSKYITPLFAVLGTLVLIGAYAAWYSYERQTKIAQVAQCDYDLVHPKSPTMMTAPDGTLVPVYSLEACVTIVVPPKLSDIIRGRIEFENIPERMKVNSYTLADVLLGRYTLGSDDSVLCDQSATTTNCATLPVPVQPEPQPYVPPNPVQPSATWISSDGGRISLYGLSFELPTGWRGSVYIGGYDGNVHTLVQKDSNAPGFTIDCPPAGKGLEAATRLSSANRTFTTDENVFSVFFEKWTAPGRDPWYFLWVRSPLAGDSTADSSAGYCLMQGNATPEIEMALWSIYETIR
jgi:hypothetical protein